MQTACQTGSGGLLAPPLAAPHGERRSTEWATAMGASERITAANGRGGRASRTSTAFPEATTGSIQRSARVADQVYRQLRSAILLGETEAGSRLREVELASRLRVSRTPVREAISRLIGDRLVRELPAGGVEVADVMAEFQEIYAIREALETCAVRLAATRIDDAALTRLEALLRAATATDHRQHRRRASINEEFHLTIAHSAGAPRLAALLNDFREFFLNPRWVSRQGQAAAEHALADHRAIIAALRARDGALAEQAIRTHLARAYGHAVNGTPEVTRTATSPANEPEPNGPGPNAS